MIPTGVLYIVGTPIGNLDDITIRALDVLKRVRLIACEDTRKSGVLLQRWEIPTQMMSLHRFSESRKTDAVLERLRNGEDVALISDAGTPGVSDPGARLVAAVRQGGFRVVPIPGPSAISAAISVSGIDCSSFVFLGFAPRKDAQKRRLFEQLANEKRPVVLFETAMRIGATLGGLAEAHGARKMVLFRELTKVHEETISGTAQEILDLLRDRPVIKGEMVLVVEGAGEGRPEIDVQEAVRLLSEEGFTGRGLADEAKRRSGLSKKEAYNGYLDLTRSRRIEEPAAVD